MSARTAPDPDDASTARPEEKKYYVILFTVYLLILGVPAAVAVWAWPDAGALAACVGALLAVMAGMGLVSRREDHGEANQHRLTLLIAFGVVVLSVVVAVIALMTRAEDVTDRSTLEHAVEMGEGDTARLIVEAKPSGDELQVTIAVESESPTTSCLPLGKLRFQGVDLKREHTVRLSPTVIHTLPLHAAGPGVSVDMTLLHSDKNCRVTLTKERVTYR